MQTVTSKDGSRIAYDRYGAGPAVILVGGALGYRKFKKMEELAQLLAERCTVINYDRRGRGDSTDVKPFALERDIEDIQALIDAEGGSASLWGWSSGGALALRAAGAAIGVERLSVDEVPFMVTPEANGRPPTTASGSTSWSRPATAAPPSSTSCATQSKYAVSSTMSEAEWNNSTVLGGDVTEEVRKLRQERDGDIVIHAAAPSSSRRCSSTTSSTRCA